MCFVLPAQEFKELAGGRQAEQPSAHSRKSQASFSGRTSLTLRVVPENPTVPQLQVELY